jgi:hypothetical protein
MADETESQTSDVPNLMDPAEEVHEQFRRTEAERARLAAIAQGAIPRGMVGDPRGAVGGATAFFVPVPGKSVSIQCILNAFLVFSFQIYRIN